MKKTLFSILLSTSIVGVNYAQSTNLDRNYVNFQYVNLPLVLLKIAIYEPILLIAI